MVLALPFFLGVLVALPLGGRLRALAHLRLRWLGLAYVALAIQIAAFPGSSLPWHTPDSAAVGLWLASDVFLVAVVVRNVLLPGVALVPAGLGSNLLAVVGGVLGTLEADPAFTSVTLDGQGVVLEDYADVRPENVDRLRTLLAAGRLEAGPWYVLPDEILVGSEALVRNLLLGRRVCRRFGVEPTSAGYEPDSFGHPAQLPQLLAGFGLHTFLFSRGMGDQIDDVGAVFRWRA